MLLDFSFSNFRSFKGEASLSMLPVRAYKEHPENMQEGKIVGLDADGVLSAAVLYGPNASGKSNVLRALDYVRVMVLGVNANSGFGWQPFVGNAVPSEFSLSVVANGVRYRYSFAVDFAGVIFEELRAQPKGDRLVFERTRKAPGVYDVKQGSSYSGIEPKLKGFSDNGLVLGLLSKFGLKPCSDVFSWIANDLVVHNNFQPIQYQDLLQKLKNLGEVNFGRAINAVKKADLGITGAQLAIGEATPEEIESQKVFAQQAKAIFEALTGETVDEDQMSSSEKITFQFQHSIGGRMAGFGFEDESLGTVTMLSLAADFLDAISNGKTLVVDEIERSLHPILLKSLIALFFDRKLNMKNAQLVFTSHDLTIMGSDLLRRDQIWFVEKGEDGQSELYPLSSYSPRKDDNVMNRYLYGAYGAVPFVDEVL